MEKENDLGQVHCCSLLVYQLLGCSVVGSQNREVSLLYISIPDVRSFSSMPSLGVPPHCRIKLVDAALAEGGHSKPSNSPGTQENHKPSWKELAFPDSIHP